MHGESAPLLVIFGASLAQVHFARSEICFTRDSGFDKVGGMGLAMSRIFCSCSRCRDDVKGSRNRRPSFVAVLVTAFVIIVDFAVAMAISTIILKHDNIETT